MAKKTEDEKWIESLLKNYERRKAISDGRHHLGCCMCDKQFTFMVLDVSRQTAATSLYCDDHYVQHLKESDEASKEARRRMRL